MKIVSTLIILMLLFGCKEKKNDTPAIEKNSATIHSIIGINWVDWRTKSGLDAIQVEVKSENGLENQWRLSVDLDLSQEETTYTDLYTCIYIGRKLTFKLTLEGLNDKIDESRSTVVKDVTCLGGRKLIILIPQLIEESGGYGLSVGEEIKDF